MSVLIEVSPNTFEETGSMKHISRLRICRGVSLQHTLQAKAYYSVLPHETWRISIKGLFRNAFLASSGTQTFRRNPGAKIRIIIQLTKKKIKVAYCITSILNCSTVAIVALLQAWCGSSVASLQLRSRFAWAEWSCADDRHRLNPIHGGGITNNSQRQHLNDLMRCFNIINQFSKALFLADSKKKRIFVRFKGYPF